MINEVTLFFDEILKHERRVGCILKNMHLESMVALSEKNISILRMRFWPDGTKKSFLKDIGLEIGLSIECVRQRIKNSRRFLRYRYRSELAKIAEEEDEKECQS